MSLIRADARYLPIADGVAACCVTSPPYFGLRDYGVSGQIGLEPTPAEYVAAIVAVFREVRRVLKDDGTAWINLGDSYAGSWGAQSREHAGKHAPNVSALSANQVKAAAIRASNTGSMGRTPGLKPKDLIGIPWRVAFALQEDGWYLRADIIWSKPNPMPESVTDRPTKAHEYLFLLSKSKSYYYDANAIKEPYAESTLREIAEDYTGEGLKDYAAAGVQNPSDVKRRIIAGARKNDTHVDHRKASVNEWDNRDRLDRESHHGRVSSFAGRNKRSVWTIPTMPYSGAHFATMPEALVEPCILAGCPLGGLVLDPFIGSGTVGAVAERLGRRWVGTDLNYQQLSKKRTAQRGLMFSEASA